MPLAYFIVEILPTLQGNRHVRVARQKVVEKLDPERELRAAQQALDIADTMANRLRVADALTALGRHSEALPLYQRGAGPRPDFRTGEKLARACSSTTSRGGAVDGRALPKVTGQSDHDRAACCAREFSRTLAATTKRSNIMPRWSTASPATRRAAVMRPC